MYSSVKDLKGREQLILMLEEGEEDAGEFKFSFILFVSLYYYYFGEDGNLDFDFVYIQIRKKCIWIVCLFLYTFHVKDTVESGNIIWDCIDLFTTESSEVHLTAFYFADNRLNLMIDYSKKKLYDLSGFIVHQVNVLQTTAIDFKITH